VNIPIKQVRHPYISVNKTIRGGEPIISGTGISVLDVAIRYEIMNMTPEEIIIALPHLNLSQIHDALSYYYEHKKEMDKKWRDAMENISVLRSRYSSVLEKKIGKIKDLCG